jgi:hypothetical protein
MKDGGLVITFDSASGKAKFQAKDNPQGGVLQMETEYGFNVTNTVNLAPGLFYFLDPNLNNAVRLDNGFVSSLHLPMLMYSPSYWRLNPHDSPRIQAIHLSLPKIVLRLPIDSIGMV